jgi:hypothetical protein
MFISLCWSSLPSRINDYIGRLYDDRQEKLVAQQRAQQLSPTKVDAIIPSEKGCLFWALIITSKDLRCRPWSTIHSLGPQVQVHHQGLLRLDRTITLAEHWNDVLYTLVIYDTRSQQVLTHAIGSL